MTQQKADERVTKSFFALAQSTRRSTRAVVVQQRHLEWCYRFICDFDEAVNWSKPKHRRWFALASTQRKERITGLVKDHYILHLLHVIDRELFTSLHDAIALEEEIAKGNEVAEGSSVEENAPTMMMRSWLPDEIDRFVRAWGDAVLWSGSGPESEAKLQ